MGHASCWMEGSQIFWNGAAHHRARRRLGGTRWGILVDESRASACVWAGFFFYLLGHWNTDAGTAAIST